MENEKIEYLAELNPEALLLDSSFNSAFLGPISRCASEYIACYSSEKCIEVLMKDMGYEEALEYFHFNILGAYVGEYTPYFLNDC